MFFFRIELASFEDAKKIIFIIPGAGDMDENGIPVFSEKALTAHSDYRQFVKETKTNVVDVSYVLYKTDTDIAEINEEKFSELSEQNALQKIDGNEINISTGKSMSGGKSNTKMYMLFGGIGAAVLVLLIASSVMGKGGSPENKEIDVSTTETTMQTSTEETHSADTSDTHTESIKPETEETVSSDNSSPEEQTNNPEGYVDEPPAETENYTIETNESTAEVYSSGGGTGGAQSEYTISFHANGGEGTLESITSEAGQYVVLPSAGEAAKSLHRTGYKLIGFSDNVEINYPLYDYRMPAGNITLFAVWEPEEYTVTYNSNGGTGQLSSVKVKYGDNVPLPTEIAVYKKDLNLSGWSKDKTAKAAVKSLKMPAENITLYAVWSEKSLPQR